MEHLRSRKALETIENSILSTYAIRASESRGRVYPEIESPSRTSYQRDVDRIVHSRAFRRLEYKTQVFVNYEGDHYRTRLTHTFEVSLVARSIARSLGLNPDLTEAVALAHDLGHTPFGHAGEEILNELTLEIGGFEHNRQSLRVVEELENRYPAFNGLNLTWEVREGLIKHTSAFDQPDMSAFEPEKRVCLEGQVVNLADELAYNCHDLEDGLRAGILTFDQLKRLRIWEIAVHEMDIEKMSEEYQRHQLVRFVKDFLVRDALSASYRAIEHSGIVHSQDARNWDQDLICFTDETRLVIKELSDFLLKNFYFHHRVVRMTTKAKWFLKDLYTRYLETPKLLPEKIQRKMDSKDIRRVVCDYIAGMTDRFALDEYQKLTDPSARV